MTKAVTAIAASGLAVGVAAAEPILVPQDASTVQEALEIAQEGDEIWVDAGKYPGFTVTTPGVTVIGDSGGGTVITGEVIIQETSTALHSLKLNQRVRTFETMTVVSCTFKNGGLQILSSNDGPTAVYDCVFTRCTTGALRLLGTDAVLENCVFDSNTIEGDGAAVRISELCTFAAADCLFKNNIATGSGGAIEGSECGTIALERCQFLQNSAGVNGGAIGALAHEFSADKCTFVGNIAGEEGGAIYLTASPCFGDPGQQRISDSLLQQNEGETVVTFVDEPDAAYEVNSSTLCDNSSQEAVRGVWSGSGTTIDGECCPADVNRDGQVTASDFPAWIDAYQKDDPRADQNDDFEVMPNDFTSWIQNFYEGCED